VNDNGSDPNAGPVSRGPSSPEKGTQALRLGAERPRITRLSRKVLAGGTALALLLISGAVLWALRSNQPHNPSPDELYSTDHHTIADGLTTLPRDYAGMPTTSHRSDSHSRADWRAPSLRLKANLRRPVWMPNNSVPTRRPRQHEPAKYLRPQRRRLPNRSRQRKRQPTRPHLRMKPSRRTGRIANFCS